MAAIPPPTIFGPTLTATAFAAASAPNGDQLQTELLAAGVLADVFWKPTTSQIILLTASPLGTTGLANATTVIAAHSPAYSVPASPVLLNPTASRQAPVWNGSVYVPTVITPVASILAGTYANATVTIDGNGLLSNVVAGSAVGDVFTNVANTFTTGPQTFQGEILATGAIVETTTVAGVHIGTASGTYRVLFANGTAAQNWQIDNNGGIFRWITPGVVRMQMNPGTIGQVSFSDNMIVGSTTTLDSARLTIQANTATTNAIVGTVVNSQDNTNTSVANGFGGAIENKLRSSTTSNRDALWMTWEWIDSTDATRKTRGKINVYDTASREAIRVDATGSAALVGIGGAVDPNGALLGVNGQVSVITAGKGLSIKTGSNCKMGTGTLAGGTATVSTTAVTSSSLIFLSDAGGGVFANIGSLSVGTVTAGTSFVVNSSNVLDSSNFNWLIMEPA